MGPFITGLILGMTIFSALSLQWAKAELANIQARKQMQDRAQAQELARALEFSVLTENGGRDQTNYSLEQATPYAAAAAKTRGGQEVLVNLQTRQDTNQANTLYNIEATQVAITASDDRLLRRAVVRKDDALPATGSPTAVANIKAMRERQVLTTTRRMDALAEQLYTYYAAKMRFPDEAAYAALLGRLNLNNAWGEPFAYQVSPDGQSAKLRFTTPWNYTQELPLRLKDTP